MIRTRTRKPVPTPAPVAPFTPAPNVTLPTRFEAPPITAPVGTQVLSFGLFEVRRGAELLAALGLREAFEGARMAMGQDYIREELDGFEAKIGPARWNAMDLSKRADLILDYLHKTYQTRRKAENGR